MAKLEWEQATLKLFAALGAWLGVGMLPIIIFLAAFIGIVFALWMRVAKEQQFAFGPSLAVAGWLLFVFNYKVNLFVHWWLQTSGF